MKQTKEQHAAIVGRLKEGGQWTTPTHTIKVYTHPLAFNVQVHSDIIGAQRWTTGEQSEQLIDQLASYVDPNRPHDSDNLTQAARAFVRDLIAGAAGE